MKHAVVLLSGGLDSATTLAIARAWGYETYALSFDYGQRHQRELEAAKKIAKSLGAKEHRVRKIHNKIFAGYPLTADVDLSLTHSCYNPLADGRACGKCDSCQLRLKGFREAGVKDPIKYATAE